MNEEHTHENAMTFCKLIEELTKWYKEGDDGTKAKLLLSLATHNDKLSDILAFDVPPENRAFAEEVKRFAEVYNLTLTDAFAEKLHRDRVKNGYRFSDREIQIIHKLLHLE